LNAELDSIPLPAQLEYTTELLRVYRDIERESVSDEARAMAAAGVAALTAVVKTLERVMASADDGK
jgi:hypothetical protein